jgi:hypothetical protein
MYRHASNCVRTRRRVSAVAVTAPCNIWALVKSVGSDINGFLVSTDHTLVSRDHILAVCVQTVEFNADCLVLSEIHILVLGLSTSYRH